MIPGHDSGVKRLECNCNNMLRKYYCETWLASYTLKSVVGEFTHNINMTMQYASPFAYVYILVALEILQDFQDGPTMWRFPSKESLTAV